MTLPFDPLSHCTEWTIRVGNLPSMNSSRSSISLQEASTRSCPLPSIVAVAPECSATLSEYSQVIKDASKALEKPKASALADLSNTEKSEAPMCDLKKVLTPKGELFYGEGRCKPRFIILSAILYLQSAGTVQMMCRTREIGHLRRSGLSRFLASSSRREGKSF